MSFDLRRSGLGRFTAVTLISALGVVLPLGQVAQALELSSAVEKQRRSQLLHWSPPAVSAAGQGRGSAQSAGGFEGAFSQPDGLAARMSPRSLQWVGEEIPTDSPWLLFDGDPRTTVRARPGQTLSLLVELAEPVWFDGVSFLGGTAPGSARAEAVRGVVQVRTPQGPVSGLSSFTLTGDSASWAQGRADAPVHTRSLLIDYQVPADPNQAEPLQASSGAQLSSGGTASSVAQASEATVALPGEWSLAVRGRSAAAGVGLAVEAALQGGSVDGGSVYRAFPERAWVTRTALSASGPQLGQFEFELPLPPQAVGRAFLVYELQGVPHFSSLPRSLNGAEPSLGRSARLEERSQARMTASGLQIEEISPSALREGRNRVEFLPVHPKIAADYAVKNLRLVVLAPGDVRQVLSTGHAPSGALHFAAPVSPTELAFELQAPSEGQLEVKSERGEQLSIDLQGLEPGWYRHDLRDSLGQLGSLQVRAPQVGEWGAVRRVLLSGLQTPDAASSRLAVTYPLHGECSNGEAYVRGFVRPSAAAKNSAGKLSGRVLVAGQELPLRADGSFEFSVEEKRAAGATEWSLPVRVALSSEEVLEEQLSFQPCVADLPASAEEGALVADLGAPFSQVVGPEGARLEWGGAVLDIPAGALNEDTKITLRPIPAAEVAALSPGMLNVTAEGAAFRLGPHGLQFNQPIELSLPYDPELLPPAASERHIVGFYFDEAQGQWRNVGRGSDATGGHLISLTDHFTDFINATVPVPDAPGAQSFMPDEMKGMELASATAGVSAIAPPQPNAQGSANVSYPIELPPGRMGMQPSLAISYSSSGGSSWLGEGWDLRLSSIELDTRFGVPDYDAEWTQNQLLQQGANQVKAGQLSYLLDGDPLVQDQTGAGGQLFRRRVEGSFQRIVRLPAGDVSGAHYFEVTDQSGVKYTYGKTQAARLAHPNDKHKVFRWLLEEVTDPFQNGIQYTYALEEELVGQGAAQLSAKQLYPQEIRYTTYQGDDAGYVVRFHRRSEQRADKRVDGRAGFLTSQAELLEQVEVLYVKGTGEQLIRRYALTYETGELGKTLLKGVALHGRQGTKLYGHDFHYRKAPVQVFTEPQQWGTVDSDLKSKTLRTTHSTGFSATLTAGGGLPGIFNIQGGGGGGLTQSWRQSSLADWTGDRLPDLISEYHGQAWNQVQKGKLGLLGLPGTPDTGSLSGRSTTIGSSVLGFTRVTDWNAQLSASGLGGLVGTSGYVGRSHNEDQHVLADMNGDGLPDHISIEKGRVQVRLNRGEGRGLGAPLDWGELDLSSIVYVPRPAQDGSAPGNQEREAAVNAQTFPVDPVIGWLAPFDGTVRISGPIQKKFAGGNGLRVRIYKKKEVLWNRFISANDLDVCHPTTSDACGSGGLSVEVKKGEFLHFRVSQAGDPAFDEVQWLPRVVYTDPSSEQKLPYGKRATVFDLATDFRVAGGVRVPWHATGEGRVEVTSTYVKPQTADELKLRVYRLNSSNKNNPERTLVAQKVLTTSQQAGQFTVANIDIGEDETLEFVATSDAVIDPAGISWNPHVRFKTYWRANPENRNDKTKRTVHCVPSPLESERNLKRCTLENDPMPEASLRQELIESEAPFNLEIPVFLSDYQEANTASGTEFKVQGKLRSSIHGDGAFLCQTPNRLLGKVSLGDEEGEKEFTFTSSDLTSGEEVTCTVISRGRLNFDIPFISEAWVEIDEEELKGLNEDLEVREGRFGLTFRELDPDVDVDRSQQGSRVGLSGGFHHWFFGDWNGARDFDKDVLQARDTVYDGDDLEPKKQARVGIAYPAAIGLKSSPTADEEPTYVSGWLGRGGAYITHEWIAPGRGTPLNGYGENGKMTSLRAAHAWNYGLEQSLVGVSMGISGSDSTTDQEFIDMNGDGLPDVLTAQGVRYNTGCRASGEKHTDTESGVRACNGTFSEVNTAFYNEVGHSETRAAKLAGSVSSGVLGVAMNLPKVAERVQMMRSQRGKEGAVRAIYDGGFSVGVNYGATSSHRTLTDVNGDGLVDYVSWSPRASHGGGRRILVRLNLGYTLSQEIEWDIDLFQDWNGDGVINQDDNERSEQLNKLTPSGVGSWAPDVANALGHYNAVNANSPSFGDTSSTSVGVSVGASVGDVGGGGVAMGYVHSLRREISSFVDVTGDGLPDFVTRIPGKLQMLVRVNLGSSFTEPQVWDVPGWDMSSGNLIEDVLTDLSYGSDSANIDVLGFERSKDYQVTTSFNFCFFFCIGASATVTDSYSHGEMSLDDINGDGLPDFVLKKEGSSAVYAKLNQLNGVNLLEKIERPWGGEVVIEYGRQGNTYEDSGSHIVMTSVETTDGRGNAYLDTFSYERDGAETGVTDRDERDFYLFGRVATIRPDGSQVVTEFENGDYYRKGLPVRVTQLGPNGAKYVETSYTYNDPNAPLPGLDLGLPQAAFPAELTRTTSYYEGQPAAGKTTTEQREWYGTHGGIKKWTRRADEGPEDDLIYEVGYQTEGLNRGSSSELYLVRANSVVAKGSNGQVYRERAASYDPTTGAVVTVTNYITGGENPAGGVYTRTPAATFIASRDVYGNITQVVDPNGYELNYEYDTTLFTHTVETRDSFNYVSSAVPNYFFGGADSVEDINGHSSVYEYDEFGRLLRVWGPNDVGTGVPTIRHEYSLPLAPGQSPASVGPLWAKTGHKDVVRNPGVNQESAHDFVETASFIDGLGRVIQTKKDLEKDLGDRLEIGTSVSGAIRFDTLGRVIQTGQPQFSQEPITLFEESPLLHPTSTTYDALDRVLTVTSPHDEPGGPATVTTITTYDFALDQAGVNRLRTTVTDPLGNRKHVLRDVDGSIVEVHEFNELSGGAEQRLITSYDYNPVDELVRVIDAVGNQTLSSYDTLGRMISLNNPDTGLTKWSYDRVGNLKSKETAQLRAKGQKVEYEHELNRLIRINYPESQDKVFVYGTASEAGDAYGNRAGRIVEEDSEAGTRELKYDRLGNITEIQMSFYRMREPHLGNYTYRVGYEYDSFGRVLKTRFPRVGQEGPQPGFNEMVSYVYDAGGNLQSSFGQNTVVNPQHPQEAHHSDYVMHIGWNEFGQKVRQIAGNFVETKYSYREKTRRLAGIDSFNRDDFQRMQNQPGQYMQQLRYEYDLVGNIVALRNDAPYSNTANASVLIATTSQSFEYDKLYQIKSASGVMQDRNDWRYTYSFAQEYDAVGNIVFKDQSAWRQVPDNGSWRNDNQNRDISYASTYSYGGSQAHAPNVIAEQLPNESSAYSRVLTYDASGNQVQNAFRGHTRSIVWNEDDQVKQVIRDGQELNRTLYDAQGQKAVHLHRVSGNEETAYLGPNLTIRDGKYITKHVFAGSERVSSKMDPAWFQYPPTMYYHSDHLGSAQYVTIDNQEMVQHAEYLPSGELWQNASDSRFELARRFLFTGKELDIHTGLYDFGARQYDARQGQWLSPDPILKNYVKGEVNVGVYLPANLNMYGFVMNNPLVLTDDDGRYAQISRVGNNVRIVVPILFRNESNLSPEQFRAQIANWQKAIEKTWSGKFGRYNVTTSVVLLTEGEAAEMGVQGSGLNVMDVTTPAKTSVSPGEATVWTAKMYERDRWDRDKFVKNRKIKGVIEEGQGRLDSDASGATAAHEVGHLLGLNHDDSMSSDDIMATIETKRTPGAVPSAAQIRKIATKFCNYECDGRSK